MSPLLYRNDVENSNARGQYFVYPEQKIKVPLLLHIHVKEELARMNVGISAAAAYNFYSCFQYIAQRFFYVALNI